MKMIKDYILSLEEKDDPYQDLWQDGEKPIITSAQKQSPIYESDRQIIKRLEARIDELEKRIEGLEWYNHED